MKNTAPATLDRHGSPWNGENLRRDDQRRGTTMIRLGICAATRWELKAVRRAVSDPIGGRRMFRGQRGSCEVIGIQTGVGAAKARAACRTMLAGEHIDLIVSSGFACALSASNIGDILIGTEVMAEAPEAERMFSWTCAPAVVEAAVRSAREGGAPARSGRFVTVPRVLWRADEKRRIAVKTEAVGLDMESAAVAGWAAERGVPCAVLRAVSDLLDEDLPMDFNLFLNPIDWPKGTLACLARPSSLLALNRLRAQAAVASERLTVFLRRFCDEYPV